MFLTNVDDMTMIVCKASIADCQRLTFSYGGFLKDPQDHRFQMNSISKWFNFWMIWGTSSLGITPYLQRREFIRDLRLEVAISREMPLVIHSRNLL